MTKKRDLLPILNKAILVLANMSGDVAKLELHDNDQASRRVKQGLVDFKYNELNDLVVAIKEVRSTVNTNKSKRGKQLLKTNKINNHEQSESE